jgi:hypothetical protein
MVINSLRPLFELVKFANQSNLTARSSQVIGLTQFDRDHYSWSIQVSDPVLLTGSQTYSLFPFYFIIPIHI